ncbi:hypothetical protein [Brachybacterium vulturis]|uniref:hypothetical protein n=1 Tax=Brachybacterium vulturis TaxID=2017484 RepID=UPI003734F86E
MSDYSRPVEPATRLLDELNTEISADLDEEAGGIGWWNGHVGWKVSAQLGEYLLASCTGVADSLKEASLAIEEHRRTEHGLNFARATRARKIAGRASSFDERIAALGGSTESELRREDIQKIWAGQALVSLAQVLDRLAAVVLVVAGVKVDVLRTDWGELSKLAARAPRSGVSQGIRQGVFADVGTPGRDRQNALLEIVASSEDHGPEDWLEWLLMSRNSYVHRAPRMNFHAMIVDKKRPAGTISPLHAQPDWADIEAMLGASRNGLEAMFLKPAPQSIFDGLRDSVSSLAVAVVQAVRDLWIERRADPSLIIQHGGTWRPLDKASVLQFPGYGPAAPTASKEVAVHPSSIRRIRAARLMGDQVGEWDC